MASLEDIFDAAIAEKEIPGVVLMATDKTGDFQYSKRFGPRSIDERQEPLKIDALMTYASFTKLITTIAALQLVERAKWRLDDPIFDILSELEGLPILTEMKDGKAVLMKRQNKITLRYD